MAGGTASGFGVKIKLQVSTDKTELQAQIQQEVSKAIKSNPIVVDNIKIQFNKNGEESLKNSISDYLDKQTFEMKTIKVKNIDAKTAVDNLRKDLEIMLSGLSIGGLKEFVGDAGTASATQKAADNLDKQNKKLLETKQIASEAEGRLTSVKNAMSALNTALRGASMGGRFTDENGLNLLKGWSNDVTRLQVQVNQLENMKLTATAEEFERLRNEILETLTSITKVSRAVKDLPASVTSVSNLTKRISDYIRLNPKVLREFPQLSGYLQTLNEKATELTKGDVAKISALFTDITTKARTMGIEGRSALDFLREGFKKFGGWSIITKSLGAALMLVRRMITNVIELDSAMTELKKVTNETDAAYDNFLKGAASTAKQVGATLTDTVSATADFARLGYSVDEAAELAEAALVYKNVGDGMADINEASESLISTMQAFGVEATDAMLVIDKFNDVSNNFAISSSGIGQALQRSAAAMQAANNTLDQTIALITTANTIVQNPESVGTTLKTISMYLRAAKTEAEEAGESTEGMANSVSELREEILALTGGKVDIMLDEDNFKSTYQILKDLSVVWKDLTDVSKANILESIAGKRNANVATALIENFEKAEEVLATSSTAAGSALEENEKYLESINGKIATMKATFEDTSNTIINSEMVEFFVELATVTLDVVNNLAKINALIPTLLTTISMIQGIGRLNTNKSGALQFLDSISENSSVDELVKSFNTLSTAQQDAVRGLLQNKQYINAIGKESSGTARSMVNLGKEIGITTKTAGSMGVEISKTTAITKEFINEADSLGLSIKNVWSNMSMLSKASIIASAAIAAFTIGKYIYDSINVTSEESYEIAMASKDNYDALNEEVSGITDSITENQERILALKEKLSKGTITFIEESELANLEKTNEELSRTVQYKREIAEYDAKEANRNLENSFNKKQFEISGVYESTLAELERQRIQLDEAGVDTTEEAERMLEIQNSIYMVKQKAQELDSIAGDGLGKEGLDDYISLLGEEYNRLNQIRESGIRLSDAEQMMYDDIRYALLKLYEEIDEDYLQQYVGDGEGRDLFQGYLDKILEIIDPMQLVKNAIDDLDGSSKGTLERLGKEGKLAAEDILDLANSGGNLDAVLKAIGGDENSAAAKVAKYFNALSLAADAVSMSTHDMYKHLAQLEDEMRSLSEYGGNVDLSNRNAVYIDKNNINRVRSWYGFEDAQIGEYMTVASQTYNANGAALVVTPILPNGDVLSQAELDSYIRGIIRESETTGNTNFSEIDSKNIVLGVFDESGWADNLDAADKFSVRLHEAHEQIIQIKNDIASIDTSSLLGSVTDVAPAYEAAEKYSETQDLIAKAQEEMNKSGSISTDTMKSLAEITDDYTKYLIAENGAIKLNVDAFREHSKTAYKDNITSIKANISALKAYRDQALKNSLANMDPSSRSRLADNQKQIDLLEQQLNLYEGIETLLSEKTGMDGLTTALGDTTTELERAEGVISRIGAGEFEDLSAIDFSNLLTALPEVEADLIACADAAENSNLSFDQQQALFKKLKDAAKALKAEKVASSLEDIASAANDFGRDSYQVQNAMNVLRQYAPELAAALEDEEGHLIDTGNAAFFTADGLLSIANVSLTGSINAMIADLNRLKATVLTTNSVSGGIIVAEKQAEIDAAKEQAAEYYTYLNQLSVNSGGGSSSTPADKIKESFDSLNSSFEHSIFLQQQYYKDAEASLDSQAMRASLLKQIEYYQRIQEEAHKAAEQLRAYYRSQGLTAAQIEMQSDIQDLSKTWWAAADSIEEATKSIYEDITKAFSDSVDEIQKVYDTLHDAADEYAEGGYITVDVLQDIVDMGVEYLAFLQDENGQLVINEERIQDIIKARTEQMAVEAALSYVEAVRAAKQANNVEELNRLLYATQNATGATWGLVYATLAMAGLSDNEYKAALNTVNSLRALANSAVESIGKTAEKTSDVLKDMQNGVDDILKYVMDMIRHEVESQVEALEDLKDSYSDLIELKKESLEATKDESDYTEQVAELTQKIAKLQSDIDLLDLVGTRESEAQKAALLEEQAELQKELANLQGDYAYDAQVDALDKMEEAYHESKDDEIEMLENTISSEEKLYQEAIKRITEFQGDRWIELYNQLIAWNTQYGSVINDEITGAWNDATAAVQRYGSFVSALNSLPGDIEAAGSSSPNYIVGNTFTDTSYSNEEAIQSIIGIMRKNATAWHSASTEQRKNLEAQNEALASQLSAFGLNLHKASGIWYLDDGRKLFEVYPNYHTGGIVGGGTPKENEEFALLKKKEWVLTEGMVDGLLKKLSLFDKVGAVVTKLTDIMSQAYRPGVGNLIHNDPPSYYSENNGRSVQVSIGDTYITGANEDTIKQHQQINKRFMDDLATQLGVRW